MRPSFVRVGRQPITWGEGRLLGEADWSPTGRVARRRARAPRRRRRRRSSCSPRSSPIRRTARPLDAYGELFGARAEWAFDPLFAIEAYAPRAHRAGQSAREPRRVRARADVHRGASPARRRARVDLGREGAYQLGHADDLGAGSRARGRRRARRVHLRGRRPALRRVRVGAAYASGDQRRRSDVPHVRSAPAGRARWHGAMDLFAWSNEAEVNARVAIVPWTDGVAAVEYRYVRLAQPGAPGAGVPDDDRDARPATPMRTSGTRSTRSLSGRPGSRSSSSRLLGSSSSATARAPSSRPTASARCTSGGALLDRVALAVRLRAGDPAHPLTVCPRQFSQRRLRPTSAWTNQSSCVG